ncbi:hypothetical protein DH09_07485 [Bacillaceae bacterium JMAK1]|nr:hypothetical protein DH09_07485 [Bacillaceae bacterium JMAK1]
MGGIVYEDVHSLFQVAFLERATDVHFHPLKEQTLVYFRKQGVLLEHSRLPRKLSDKLIAHLKFQSGMDIGERRMPQDGSLSFHFGKEHVAIRLSTMPITFGERLAARLLPLSDHYQLDTLTTDVSAKKQLQQFCTLTHGLILLTGPTGSGKTTTMYALLKEISNDQLRHIISVEDPIEKPNPLYTQLQVNEQAGLSYANALKAALRHDPDVLMIGEIRDEVTAKIAVRAAMTGHLVLTSLHTRHPAGALVRLMEFGLSANYLYESVVAVVSQTLVAHPSGRMASYQFLSGEPLMLQIARCQEQNLLDHELPLGTYV